MLYNISFYHAIKHRCSIFYLTGCIRRSLYSRRSTLPGSRRCSTSSACVQVGPTGSRCAVSLSTASGASGAPLLTSPPRMVRQSSRLAGAFIQSDWQWIQIHSVERQGGGPAPCWGLPEGRLQVLGIAVSRWCSLGCFTPSRNGSGFESQVGIFVQETWSWPTSKHIYKKDSLWEALHKSICWIL